MPFSDIVRTVADQFHRDSIPVLRRRGWRPRVIPYDGYGSADRAQHAGTGTATDAEPAPRDMARVLARMVMRPPNAPSEGPLFQRLPEQLPASPRDVRRQAAASLLEAQRGWRMFIDVPVPHLPVTVRLGGVSVRT
ncbi:hypothetical protein RWX45_12830, partial [Actinomyces sp. MRS3W]|nr:hypothetical protein [Actinomyces sp. MRS3W]